MCIHNCDHGLRISPLIKDQTLHSTSRRPVQSVDAEAAVSTILDTMNSALVRGHRIEIRGVGSFAVIHRAPRLGRNPRSGAAVDIPERRQAHFKVGKALREAVNLPAVDVDRGHPK